MVDQGVQLAPNPCGCAARSAALLKSQPLPLKKVLERNAQYHELVQGLLVDAPEASSLDPKP